MPPRNQEKADFIAWRMRNPPTPGRRIGADVRRYYGNLWYREDDNRKYLDVASERALRAQEAEDDEADDEAQDEGEEDGAGDEDADNADSDEVDVGDEAPAGEGGTSSDDAVAGPPRPHVGSKGPARPTVGGKNIALFGKEIQEEAEKQRRAQEAAADQGNAADDESEDENGRSSSGGSGSRAPRTRLGGKRPPGQRAAQSARTPGTTTGIAKSGQMVQGLHDIGKRPPQAKKRTPNPRDTPPDNGSEPDDESESGDSESSTGSDRVLDRLSYDKEGEETDKKKRLNKFIIEHPPFTAGGLWEPGWQVPGFYLDAGGGGIVYVYRRQADGRFVDRVAVKDSIVEHACWTAFENWHGDVRDVENRQHMEIHCLDDVAKAGGSKNILHLRGHEVNNERMWYRLYTCFCAYGDLYDLYKDWKNGGVYLSLEDIPEPAVWSLFNDLVNACLVLQYGAVEENEAVDGWVPIIHRDLKDGNVFLDMREEGDAEFPNYPRARIGDFGVATRATEDDLHNPFAYIFAGTERWDPVELCRLKSHRTFVPVKGQKIGEKTNVWGIGAIIIRLMSRDTSPEGPIYTDGVIIRETDQSEPSWANNGNTDVYSKELRDLARSCVNFHAKKRPTLRFLREQILRYTSGDEDLASGMRAGVKTVAEGNKLRHKPEDDKYKIQFARAKRPRLK